MVTDRYEGYLKQFESTTLNVILNIVDYDFVSNDYGWRTYVEKLVSDLVDKFNWLT